MKSILWKCSIIVLGLALVGCAGGPKPSARIADQSAQTKAAISSYATKATPVAADKFLISDSEASWATKNVTFDSLILTGNSDYAFIMGTLGDLKILTTAQPVNGENLIDDTVTYTGTEDNLRVWSIEKVGGELAGKQAADADLPIDAIEFVIDGGGSAITTGVKGFLEIPYAATIQRVTTLCDQSGSIVVDLWKDSYANYPPTVADTITASAKPTLSTTTKAQDATLTGWTTSVSAGDIIGYNVDSATTVTRCTISLKVTK